jgi:manganese/zinc/iron transport system permease protein
MNYFTDPILRAPTIGCILMCVAASLMGVVLLLQRRLLVGESISHAAYPGAILGILALALLGPEWEEYSFLAVLIGALGSSWLGMKAIERMERKIKIRSDAALCFTLAIFFGFGILLASWLQESLPQWASQAQVLLFGQAATLTDEHIMIYALLALGCTLFILFAFRPLQALLFDRGYSKSIGINTRSFERALFWLLLFSIVVGIRSVGVILMSGMLIAPAIAARQFSNHLKTIFLLSALIGALSGLLGNVLSVEIALRYDSLFLPTGPMIILVSATFALLSLLFSPKRGIAFRLARLASFRLRCLEENILKEIWKRREIEFAELKRHYHPILATFVLQRLIGQGWVDRKGGVLTLSDDGQTRAASIVRLHRLWELYLTEQLGWQAEKVHMSAEEMEHILTPELEERLTKLLSDPQRDPHAQPIPQKRPVL